MRFRETKFVEPGLKFLIEFLESESGMAVTMVTVLTVRAGFVGTGPVGVNPF